MKRLIETLTEFPSATPQVTALSLILDRVGAVPEEAADLEPELQRLVTLVAKKQLSGMAAYTWERGCMICLQRGLVDTALEAAIAAIGSVDRYGSDGEAWKIIVEVSRTDPVKAWKALASLIGRREAQSYRIALEMESHGIVSVIPPAAVMEWVDSDVSRSVIVALMCDVHSVPLNELARQLIIQFGPGSPAARELAARAHSTPHVVPSLAGFAKSQLENARQWAQDPEPGVAEWGKRLVETTQESYEQHAAREEFEEREWR